MVEKVYIRATLMLLLSFQMIPLLTEELNEDGDIELVKIVLMPPYMLN